MIAVNFCVVRTFADKAIRYLARDYLGSEIVVHVLLLNIGCMEHHVTSSLNANVTTASHMT